MKGMTPRPGILDIAPYVPGNPLAGGPAKYVNLASNESALGPSPRAERYDPDQGYQASFDGVIAHFVECLETGAPFETGPADNLETLRVVHALYQFGEEHVARKLA